MNVFWRRKTISLFLPENILLATGDTAKEREAHRAAN